MLLCFNVMSGILERVPNPTPIFFYYADILDLGVGQWGPFSSSGASVLLLPKPLHNTNKSPVVPFLASPLESENKS